MGGRVGQVVGLVPDWRPVRRPRAASPRGDPVGRGDGIGLASSSGGRCRARRGSAAPNGPGVRPRAPRRGRAGRQLVLSPDRPRSEHRAGGLGAQPLVADISEQRDARNQGQQPDRAGLADLGQVMNGARTGLAVAQQLPLGISDQASVITSALTVFARALPEMHRCRPRNRRRAAHPHLGGIQQAQLPAGAQVGDHVGQRAQPNSALHGAFALTPAAGAPLRRPG